MILFLISAYRIDLSLFLEHPRFLKIEIIRFIAHQRFNLGSISVQSSSVKQRTTKVENLKIDLSTTAETSTEFTEHFPKRRKVAFK